MILSTRLIKINQKYKLNTNFFKFLNFLKTSKLILHILQNFVPII